MKKAKQLISLFLVAVMIGFSLPVPAQAAANCPAVSSVATGVDKYGNITTDINSSTLTGKGYAIGDILKITFGTTSLQVPFCTTYSDVDDGEPLICDSKTGGPLVAAVKMGNFSTKYNVKQGVKLTFSLSQKGGYLEQYKIHHLTRTNNRADYPTDSVFANFRGVTTTGIKPGILYRSSSPVDNVWNRAAYADRLAKDVGVNTVLNLTDSDDEIKACFAKSDFNSAYYKSLYNAGNVKALHMGVDMASSDFSNKLAECFRYIINHDGPYLVHCSEGKDRAGYVSAVLESLMGAKLDEVVADYMLTYENYYGVKQGTKQYTSIADSNIIASMTTIVCGSSKGTDISGVDLAAATENYLKKIGLTSDEITAVKTKLSGNSTFKSPEASGTVQEIEKYGHALTDLLIKDLNDKGFQYGDMVTVLFQNGFVLEAPYLDGYYVDAGNPLVRAYPGQTNVAICINYGKLNEIANIKIGDKFTIMMANPAGYQAQYQIRKLKRTNNRQDYSSDAVFANFRNIMVGNIAKGVLYRSSSPVDNQLGRAAYADKLMKAAGVNTVINLSDADKDIKASMAAKGFASPYYQKLYQGKKVLPLNMGLSYSNPAFKADVIKGLEFMAANKGPYLFHCTEGKDRTGFYAALVESLMGGSKDAIVQDYMQSYVNYYNVQKGTDQYNLISNDVISMLKTIGGTENVDKADLAVGAKKYLLAGGMSEKEVKALMANLSVSGKQTASNEWTPDQTGSVYIVLPNDSLWKIAQEQLGDGKLYWKIYQSNKKSIQDSNKIYVGQRLILPK